MNILIIDDVAIDRKMIQRLLTAEGHVTLTANSGLDALGVLAKNPHLDAVVCDLMMPDIDGIEVYRRYLKRRETIEEANKTKLIPFILLSATQSVGRLKYAKEIGFFEILTKPLDYKRLRSALARIEGRGESDS